MSIKKTLHTAWTSYASMACVVITSLLTLRLATGSLSKEEFGLWSFTTQSIGYFLLLDFGVANSLSRLFGEPIASGNQKSINSWFTLSFAVLILQGLLIMSAGLLLGPYVMDWFNIPADLREQADLLWKSFLILQAVNFPMRVASAILYAQNRAYLTNIIPFLTAWFSLIIFYLMLKSGAGVLAYVWSSAIGVLLSGIFGVIAVLRGPNKFRFSFCGVSYNQIKELFSYSFSVFAVSIAVQIVFSSQTLIITKLLGLSAGAIYNVTSRLPLLAMQMLWRPFDAFGPRWQTAHCAGSANVNNVMVSSEIAAIARITFLASSIVAVGIIIINPIFVKFLAKDDYFGGGALNCLLAAFLMIQTLSHCYSFAFTLHKKMKVFTRVVCLNAILSVIFMTLGAKYFGLPGIPLGLLAADFFLGVWFNVIMGGSLIGLRVGNIVIKDLAVSALPLILAVLISFYWNKFTYSSIFFETTIASIVTLLVCSPILLVIFKLVHPSFQRKKSQQSCT